MLVGEHSLATMVVPCIGMEVQSCLGSTIFLVAELVESRLGLCFNFHILGRLLARTMSSILG